MLTLRPASRSFFFFFFDFFFFMPFSEVFLGTGFFDLRGGEVVKKIFRALRARKTWRS